MIHSLRLMPTGNFIETDLPAPHQPLAPERTSPWPCAYYSAPLSEVRPVLPGWVPYGCGGAAAIFMLLLLATGALLSGERIKGLLDLVVGVTLGEMKPMYASDVTVPQTDEFEAEVKRMRDSLRAGTISVQNVQPFFQAMQKAVGDETVTADELEMLTEAARMASKGERRSR